MPITHHNSDWLVEKRIVLPLLDGLHWVVYNPSCTINLDNAFFGSGRQRVASALFLAYGVQGFAAELIGVKVEPSGISCPNRAFPRFPYLILFRRRLPAGSFDRWRAIPKDLPPRSTVYDYFDLWSWDGTLDRIQ